MANSSVLIIGCFDGLHKGHRELIKQAISYSDNQEINMLTFNPHPRLFFSEKKTDFMISSLEQKFNIIKSDFPEIKMMVAMQFDQDFSELSAEGFIKDIVIDNLEAKIIVAGNDFCFGHKSEGNINLLKELESKYNFQVKTVDNICDNNGNRYSSTSIRNLIRDGKIKEANMHLGYTWQVSGNVVEGNRRGMKYHTANIEIGSYVWPKFGVYAVKVCLNNELECLPAVANFGICPTYIKKNKKTLSESDVSLQVHILNGFDSNIYGQKINVNFIDFIREERKFANASFLEEQIKEDCRIANSILGNFDIKNSD